MRKTLLVIIFIVSLISTSWALTVQQINNQEIETDINIIIQSWNQAKAEMASFVTQADNYGTLLRIGGINWPGVNWADPAITAGVNWPKYGY